MSTSKPTGSELKFAVFATDTVCFRIIERQLSVLLGKVDNQSVFAGKWAVIGGLVSPKDTADTSVERHLKNKAGIDHVYKEQLYTFSAVDRDPRGRVVSVAYMALAYGDPQSALRGTLETKWFPIDMLPQLAYDHAEIVSYAIGRLRNKIRYTNIAQYLLPEEFTLSELQSVYEVVLQKGIDKRNFRKKILATSLLTDTGMTRKQGVMRPAALYKFLSKDIEVVEII